MNITADMLEKSSDLMAENSRLKQTLGQIQRAWFYDDIEALEECLYEHGAFWKEADEEESHDLD